MRCQQGQSGGAGQHIVCLRMMANGTVQLALPRGFVRLLKPMAEAMHGQGQKARKQNNVKPAIHLHYFSPSFNEMAGPGHLLYQTFTRRMGPCTRYQEQSVRDA